MLDKWMNVLQKNLGYTIVMIIAIVFFVYFSEGVIEGLIAAVAAMLAFTCGATLYKEYKKEPDVKKVATAKKTAGKKAAAKKKN